ncbi:unannotated protein [freshwater metagenome]|uniref:Unannotated protein n=1 Tax=freshwater metagenome TaxID=449393 RepID=A0A6J7E1H2_9ZZZZ
MLGCELLDERHVDELAKAGTVSDQGEHRIRVLRDPAAHRGWESKLLSKFSRLRQPSTKGAPQQPLRGAVTVLE